MEALLLICGLLLIYLIYFLGKFIAALRFNIHERQVFMGFGRKPLFSFKIKNLNVLIGWYIPLPWLARIYAYKEGEKFPLRYEWEFYERPPGERLLAIFSGSLAMILSSVLIFIVLEYQDVDRFISKSEVDKYGIYPSDLGRTIGFEKGDRVIALNGKAYERYSELQNFGEAIENGLSYKVLRGQDSLVVSLSADQIDEWLNNPRETLFALNTPLRIGDITDDGEAQKAGLESGDQILRVGGDRISSFPEYKFHITSYRSTTVEFELLRNNNTLTTEVYVPQDTYIGFIYENVIQYDTKPKSLAVSIIEGSKRPFVILYQNLRALLQLSEGSTKGIKGPVRIANLYGPSLSHFFRISGILLILAVFYDLMPFPRSSLVRCYPVFAEIISGRKVSPAQFRTTQKALWIPLWGIVIWQMFSDIIQTL